MNATTGSVKMTAAEERDDLVEQSLEIASNTGNADRGSSISEHSPPASYFQINKPLFPLKVALFCWHGGNMLLKVFTPIFLSQCGLPVGEYSFILSFSPLFQLLGSTISGMLADKLGRQKLILFMNLSLATISVNSMLFLPLLKSDSSHNAFITCASRNVSNGSMITYCDITDGDISLISCSFHCAADLSPLNDFCFQDYISHCDLLKHHDLPDSVNFQKYDSGTEPPSLCANEHEAHKDILNNSAFCSSRVATECISSCKENKIANSSKAHFQNYANIKLFLISFLLLTSDITFSSNCYRVFDFTAMSMIKFHGSHFGRQRLWSVIGILVCSPVAGALVSFISSQTESKRYNMVFFLFDALIVVVIFAAWKLDVKAQPRTKNILVKFFMYSKNLDRGIFLLVVLVCGTMWNFQVYLGNLYLAEELGAPGVLIGLNPAIVSVCSLPFLFTSHWFVKKLGSTNIFLLALGAHMIRYIGFSYLTNPWLSLLYQPLGVLSYHLLWVAVVLHTHNTAPSGFAATAVSITGSIHFGAGRGIGSLVGGFIMSKYGGRTAHRVLGTICAITAVLYSLFLYVRRNNKNQFQEPGQKSYKQENSPPKPENVKTNLEDPN